MTVEDMQLRLGEPVPTDPAPAPRGSSRPARQAPLARCGCGRQHRTWNPRKLCKACVRESRSAESAELTLLMREQERERLERLRSPEHLAILQAIHERWLARQAPDHPWRLVRAGGEA